MRFLPVMALLLIAVVCARETAVHADPRSDERKEADRTARPYLYFTPATLETFKAKLKKEPFASRWTKLIAVANQFAVKPVSEEFVIGTERSRESAGLLDVLGLAYAVTGEKRYGERAKQEVWSLLSQKAWHEPKDWNKGAELCTAECSYGCARFYDWCHDTLTDDDRKYFRERALELSLKPYLQSADPGDQPGVIGGDWWMVNWTSHWCGVCNGGCGLLGLALYDDLPEARQAAVWAYGWVYKFLDNGALGSDGDNGEGIECWRYGTTFALAFRTAWDHVNDENFWDVIGLHRRAAGYWDVYMQGPDQRYANFNEMDEETFMGLWSKDPANLQGGPSGALNALFETRTAGGDPLLLWAADNGGGGKYDGGISVNWFLWRRDTGPAGEKPQLDRNALFRSDGHAILGSDSLWLAYNGGQINGRWIYGGPLSDKDRSHRNFDLGSFVLVCDGERFIHDPGRGHPETAKHSTILVNGLSQLDGTRATFQAFHEGEKYSWFLNDLSASYGSRIKRAKRSVIMVRGRYVVILDDVETSSTTDVEIRFQSRCGISTGDAGATLTGRGKLNICAAAPAVVASTGDSTDAVKYVALKARNPAATVLFVTVLHPGDAPQIGWSSEADAATLTVGDDKLEFTRSDATWIPRSICSETVPEPAEPTERTFKLFTKE
jgi:hypothetical protein